MGAQAGAGVTSRTGPLPHPGAPQGPHRIGRQRRRASQPGIQDFFRPIPRGTNRTNKYDPRLAEKPQIFTNNLSGAPAVVAAVAGVAGQDQEAAAAGAGDAGQDPEVAAAEELEAPEAVVAGEAVAVTETGLTARRWRRAARRDRSSPLPDSSPRRPSTTTAPKRSRQEEGETGRPTKKSRWEPSPSRPCIPFAVTLAAARATAAATRTVQPPPQARLPATPAARPSWPPTPTRPMDKETRDYYMYYATNFDSLAPKYQAPGADPLPAAEQGQGVGGEEAEGQVRGGAREGAGQGGRVRAQTETEERETIRRQRLAYQARIQEELHQQRRRMDEARYGLMHRRDQAQEQLQRERERLAARAWWRRPTSSATSSWVRTGGARTTVTPTNPASAPTTTWPTLEASMLVNVGDRDAPDVDCTVLMYC